jgi:alkylhydroperoxidase family enzyme
MSRVQELADGPTELDQVWGLRPEYYQLFIDDYLRSLGNLNPVLVELCRIQLAQMVESRFDESLRYQPAIDAGLTEGKLLQLASYPTSPEFTPAERGVLEFAEQWVIQSSSITDDDVSRVQELISPEEFIYLCKALSVMDQFARANAIFNIGPASIVPELLSEFVTAPAAR